MKKILSLILAALLLSSAFCSCGESRENNDSDTPASAEAVEGTVAEAEAEPESTVDDLFTVQKTDYGGTTVHILTTENHPYEFNAVEYTGEGVNDAVFDRNAAVEELLGIDFEFIYKPDAYEQRNEFNGLIRASVMANDGAYDITSGMISCIMPVAGGNLFHNLYDIPGMNLDNPWWVSEMQKDLTLNGKLYGIIGDVCLSMYTGLLAVFANTTLLNSVGAESIYDIVRSGSWTLDKMTAMSESYTIDNNGDGAYEVGTDLIGTVFDGGVALNSLQVSLNHPTFGIGEDGLPAVLPVSDAAVASYDKLVAMFASPYVQFTGNLPISTVFTSEQAIFVLAKLNLLNDIRDMDDDYAVIPSPKANENQSRYYTQIATATQIMFVPVTVTETEMIGQTLEALNYYSFKGVVPQYYEVTVKTKLARDKDTREMLDVIREGALLPFDSAYSTALGGSSTPNAVLSECARNGRPYASTIASNTKVWERAMKKILERYE